MVEKMHYLNDHFMFLNVEFYFSYCRILFSVHVARFYAPGNLVLRDSVQIPELPDVSHQLLAETSKMWRRHWVSVGSAIFSGDGHSR